MKRSIPRFFIPALTLFVLATTWGCKGDGGSGNESEDSLSTSQGVAYNLFDADSAYEYIAAQVAFGTRIPNTPTHKACGDWLKQKLASFGFDVISQEATVVDQEGKNLPITNIIGQWNPQAERRILLLAHWDTRPIADHDPDPSKTGMPILGADDAASGVGVLLEVARQLAKQQSSLGVDILLVDAEDSGTSENEESWCLGSTYWSKNPHKAGYRAEFGILLDMVGAQDAKFRWELFSKLHAPSIVSTFWDKAASLGYGSYFIQADGAGLTDDHRPIIDNLAIPTIDIVNYDPARPKGFGTHWHTHADTMEIIDRATLRAVGETLISYLKDLEEVR